MPDQANVNSLDAIQSVRAALLQFAKLGGDGLTDCELEMRRMLDWMEHDRPAYWKERVRLAHDAVHKAKGDLHRCLMYPVGVNDRPACTEERAALKKAEAHLAYCREKQERLKHWVREIRHEVHTYQGRTTQLREVIESDMPTAAAALGRMLVTLEQYAQLASPSNRRGAGAAGSAGTNADAADEPAKGDPSDTNAAAQDSPQADDASTNETTT